MKQLLSSILNYPREILLVIDQKIGIEIFKLGLVFSVVYFVQGMGGLSNIPLLFYFKDVLKFSEDQIQNFGAITMLAWLIKPLFGYISDRFPICGYRRKSYMILMASVAAISWWLLAWMVSQNYNQYLYLVLVFNFSSLGYAFVDVVCDGLMVERGQSLKKEDIFVNIQWFALGIAGVIAGTFSGQLQQAVKTEAMPLSLVFIIVGCVPLLTSVISWFFIKEEKIAKPAGKKDISEQKADFSLIKEVICSKIFWLLSIFIFFWKFSPSFGAVFQYYSIDILKFDEIFLGKITAVGNAIFPLSILLYGGMLKWLPQIKTKHYLYGSVVIGLIYSAVSLLFYVPENTFNWVRVNLPFGDNVISIWIIPLLLLLVAFSAIICWRVRKRISLYRIRIKQKNLEQNKELKIKRILVLDKKIKILRRIRFYTVWLILLPLSLIAALWFSGIAFSPFILSYRSLSIADNVIFGYTSIASFLIPLTLAAKLAPKKAEGMTYAYFMALSNVSGNFLPSITGAQMFKILKGMLLKPETIIKTIPIESLLIVMAGVGAIILMIVWIWLIVKVSKGHPFFPDISFRIVLFIWLSAFLMLTWEFAPVFLAHLKQLGVLPVYIVQQSYLVLQTIIGNADFLGKNAYRALILRYSTFIGVGFMLTSVLFIYLLPLKKEIKK